MPFDKSEGFVKGTLLLVVRDGVKLPSNLQGLLELRYKGDTLDVNETVRLMEAMKDMKSRALPPAG